MEYRDRVAIVTGASSGIGQATARELARRGAVVVGVARREGRLQELAEACRRDSPHSGYLAGDLGQRAFAEHIVNDTEKRHGRVDILINNAAIPMRKQFYRTTVEDAENAFRINFFSCLWTTYAAIPAMLRQGGGSIVNVSSFAAKVVPTHETLYAATKCAMNGFSEGLWNDLAGSNIHVALVSPGPIDTEIWGKGDEPEGYSGRKYPPEDVAREICRSMEKRRHEVIVPRGNFQLLLARFLRLVLPGVLRAGVRRMDPVPPEALERARRRAADGLPLGE